MNISYKTKIEFQDLQISVKMVKVNHENNIELNQLCKNSKERVKYLKYCPSCNKEITNEDIVKGYQYSKSPDKYIILDKSDINSITTNQDKTLNIQYFCKQKDINKLSIDRSYYLVPEMDSEIKYNLFRKAMTSNRVVAITEIVLGTKQELVALIPNKECIIATILFYSNEIIEPPINFNYKVDKNELKHLKKLIFENVKYFDWSTHYDKYQVKLKELIMSKIPNSSSGGSVKHPTNSN